LVEAYENNPDYKPCYNCLEWGKNKWGTPWLKKITIDKPLTGKEAVKAWEKFFTGNEHIKLVSFPNGSLTTKIIDDTLDAWKKEGFEPDLVAVDYGDIVESDVKGEFRHQENDKWKKFRGMSQKTNALWIIPTQTKSTAYKKKTIRRTDIISSHSSWELKNSLPVFVSLTSKKDCLINGCFFAIWHLIVGAFLNVL